MVGGGTFPPSCKLSRHKDLLNEETNGADQPSHHHPLMDQHTERGRGVKLTSAVENEKGGFGLRAGVMSGIAARHLAQIIGNVCSQR